MLSDANAIVKATATEIVAGTAYNLVSGSLHLMTTRIVGTRTGVPVLELNFATWPI